MCFQCKSKKQRLGCDRDVGFAWEIRERRKESKHEASSSSFQKVSSFPSIPYTCQNCRSGVKFLYWKRFSKVCFQRLVLFRWKTEKHRQSYLKKYTDFRVDRQRVLKHFLTCLKVCEHLHVTPMLFIQKTCAKCPAVRATELPYFGTWLQGFAPTLPQEH